MPPTFVKTIRELIYWQYAKLIAKAAGLENQYGFITSRFKKLKNGEIKMSGIVRDDKNQLKREKNCIYCGHKKGLSFDHIIPKSKGGFDDIHNQVLACNHCNSSKGKKDVFEWYGIDKKDKIPKLVIAKYLKMVYNFHKKNKTLDKTDLNKDGKLDVLDLGIFKVKR